jgi:hypothetical protein
MLGGRTNRRAFIAALGGAVAWPVVALAQQQPKFWRIGMLQTVSADLNAANLGAFQQSMRHLGYKISSLNIARPTVTTIAFLAWSRS